MGERWRVEPTALPPGPAELGGSSLAVWGGPGVPLSPQLRPVEGISLARALVQGIP